MFNNTSKEKVNTTQGFQELRFEDWRIELEFSEMEEEDLLEVQL